MTKPFEEEPAIPTEIKGGVKLSNTKSMFSQKQADKASFDERAQEYVAELSDRNKRAFDLAKQFLDLVRDKTLTENKSVLLNDVERDVKNKLLELAIEINNDENEVNDGMGSIAVVSILLKAILLQRDMINNLDYKVHSLEKSLKKVSSPVKESV